MRKIGVRVCFLLLGLLTVHCVFCCFLLSRISTIHFRLFSQITEVTVYLHMLVCSVFLFRICRNALKTKRLYFRENLRYWGQLSSGICIFLLIPVHVWAFTVKSGDHFFFKELSLSGYLLEILFVTMVYVHVMLGIAPLCVAAGWRDLPTKRTICRTICTILYLLSVAAITYYTRMWVIQ